MLSVLVDINIPLSGFHSRDHLVLSSYLAIAGLSLACVLATQDRISIPIPGTPIHPLQSGIKLQLFVVLGLK